MAADTCVICKRPGAHYMTGDGGPWHTYCLPDGGRRPMRRMEVKVAGIIDGKRAAQLDTEARRRGMTPQALAMQIIATVIDDDLFRAVLD